MPVSTSGRLDDVLLVVGVLSGLFAVVFLSVEHALTGLIWGHDLPWEGFDGGSKAVAVPVVAGLIVGGLYLLLNLPPRLDGFLEEMEAGRVEPSTAPAAVGVTLVSLVGGASLGPEAALATGAGGIATWWAERRRTKAGAVRSQDEMAVSGVFGGLLSIELEHQRSPEHTLRNIVPVLFAGVGGVPRRRRRPQRVDRGYARAGCGSSSPTAPSTTPAVSRPISRAPRGSSSSRPTGRSSSTPRPAPTSR